MKFVCLLLPGSCKNGFVKIWDYRKDAPVQNTEDFINRKVAGRAGRETESATGMLPSKGRAKLGRFQRREGPEKECLREVHYLQFLNGLEVAGKVRRNKHLIYRRKVIEIIFSKAVTWQP